MKKLMLFLMLFAFGFLASSFTKANEDSEKFRTESCIYTDSDLSIDIQKQLINPGRIYVKGVGKEYHNYNFIYTKRHTKARHYIILKPPVVGMKT